MSRNMPNCWVVIKDGQIIATHDEPGHYDGIQAVRYAPAAPVQEPVAIVDEDGVIVVCNYKYKPGDKLYTTPPAQPAPVQVSPLEFVTMVMEKEHLVGKPLFWAEWPNKENT